MEYICWSFLPILRALFLIEKNGRYLVLVQVKVGQSVVVVVSLLNLQPVALPI